MNYLLSIFFILLSIASSAHEVNFQSLSFSEAMKKAKIEGKSVFVDFYTDWCAPCKRLEVEVFNNKELANSINSNYIAIRVNADYHSELADSFNIISFPTVLIFDNNGAFMSRIKGVQPVANFLKEVNYLLESENNELSRFYEIYGKGRVEDKFILDFLSILKDRELLYENIADKFVLSNFFNPREVIHLNIFQYSSSDVQLKYSAAVLNDFNVLITENSDLAFSMLMRLSSIHYRDAFISKNRIALLAFVNENLECFSIISSELTTTELVIDFFKNNFELKIESKIRYSSI